MSDDWWTFDCACGRKGLNFDDGTAMWECSKCGAWQHAACAGGSEDAEAPDDYACFRCRSAAETLLPSPHRKLHSIVIRVFRFFAATLPRSIIVCAYSSPIDSC